MTADEILKKLESLGKEKNRELLKSLGAGDNVYGVSGANLEKLKSKIGSDGKLAAELWNSVNIDAQTLACMIADPEGFPESDIDAWTEKISFYQTADLFVSEIVIPAGYAKTKMTQWLSSPKPLLVRCAYRIMEHLAKQDSAIDNDRWMEFLYRIEKEIHTAPDRVKEAMNLALIAIGEKNKVLNMEALIIGMRIGQMTIEHGGKETKLPYSFQILGNKKLKQQLPDS